MNMYTVISGYTTKKCNKKYKMYTMRYNTCFFMKKLFFLLFIFISINISAQDELIIKFNLGSFGGGTNVFQNSEHNNGELFYDILNTTFESGKTRIGLENTLVKIWGWNSLDDDESSVKTGRWSFFNFRLFWNIFDVNFDISDEQINFYIGPFTGINYMYVGNWTMKWKEYIYSAGLRFGFAFDLGDNVYYNMIETEIGYRLINGNNTFYFTIKVDVITAIVIFLSVRKS